MVHSFSDEKKLLLDVPIGAVVTAWVEIQEMGELVILIMNGALYFSEHLDHTLIYH